MFIRVGPLGGLEGWSTPQGKGGYNSSPHEFSIETRGHRYTLCVPTPPSRSSASDKCQKIFITFQCASNRTILLIKIYQVVAVVALSKS